jgi:hypothetical protein
MCCSIDKAPAGIAAPHRRIRDGLQTNSPIFSDFRGIAVFEPRLSKSADRAATAICNRKKERNLEPDAINARYQVTCILPQD